MKYLMASRGRPLCALNDQPIDELCRTGLTASCLSLANHERQRPTLLRGVRCQRNESAV